MCSRPIAIQTGDALARAQPPSASSYNLLLRGFYAHANSCSSISYWSLNVAMQGCCTIDRHSTLRAGMWARHRVRASPRYLLRLRHEPAYNRNKSLLHVVAGSVVLIHRAKVVLGASNIKDWSTEIEQQERPRSEGGQRHEHPAHYLVR